MILSPPRTVLGLSKDSPWWRISLEKNKTWSTISSLVKFLFNPILPVAQKPQFITQPAWEETQTVFLPALASFSFVFKCFTKTVSIIFPSFNLKTALAESLFFDSIKFRSSKLAMGNSFFEFRSHSLESMLASSQLFIKSQNTAFLICFKR